MKSAFVAFMLVAFAATARCAPVSIVISNYQFGNNNAPVTVNVGDTVIWSNTDDAAHTVTCTDPNDPFDSGNLDSMQSYSHMFSHAGIFSYVCAYHGFMQSNIIVKPAGSTDTDVIIYNFAFTPSSVTIKAGETVRWTEKDNFSHTVTSGATPNPDGKFDQAVPYQTSFSHTFTEPGTYPYFCRPHSGFMTGTVVVTPSAVGARGDVNGDGSVTTADVLEGLSIMGGFTPMASGALGRLDVAPAGGDGVFDLLDVLRINRFVAGLDTTPL